MATKTLTITEESYERLASKKKDNESFSDVINRITNKKSIMEFCGILSNERAESLRKSIEESRASTKKRLKELDSRHISNH